MLEIWFNKDCNDVFVRVVSEYIGQSNKYYKKKTLFLGRKIRMTELYNISGNH